MSRDAFQENGYVFLPGEVHGAALARLETECEVLLRRAADILRDRVEEHIGPAAPRASTTRDPIVVAESDNPLQICRMEYLAGCSRYIREVVAVRLAALIDGVLGRPVALFKDKCNMKYPNGGAFPPHQDITAYRYFQASYHVTAAVMLDDATVDNGCLEMAEPSWRLIPSDERRDTPRGPLPILPSYRGGDNNGDIVAELAAGLRWIPIEASRGDVLLFDSYVPHRSKQNLSEGSRKIMLFTFNLQSDGDLYEAYYRAKRDDAENPIFHVSTPTRHDGQRGARPSERSR